MFNKRAGREPSLSVRFSLSLSLSLSLPLIPLPLSAAFSPVFLRASALLSVSLPLSVPCARARPVPI